MADQEPKSLNQKGVRMANFKQTKTKHAGVSKLANGRFLATWTDQSGRKHRRQCPTYKQAIKLRDEGQSDHRHRV